MSSSKGYRLTASTGIHKGDREYQQDQIALIAHPRVNGCVLEFGRKIWAPQNERDGVETYSALLGPQRAVRVWLAICGFAWVLLSIVGYMAGAFVVALLLGLVALVAMIAVGVNFLRNPTPKEQRRLDTAAGLWVFACYAIAGFSPFLGQVVA